MATQILLSFLQPLSRFCFLAESGGQSHNVEIEGLERNASVPESDMKVLGRTPLGAQVGDTLYKK